MAAKGKSFIVFKPEGRPDNRVKKVCVPPFTLFSYNFCAFFLFFSVKGCSNSPSGNALMKSGNALFDEFLQPLAEKKRRKV